MGTKMSKFQYEEERDTLTREVQQQRPRNYEQILKDPTDTLQIGTEKPYDYLHRGVFLNKKRKKYWIDDNRKNCFMLYAKDLSIIWGEDHRYWCWPMIKESNNESLVAAELIEVCWLEVRGRFNTVNLTPRTHYEVFFVVMLKYTASGWEVPVNVRLILADGTTKEGQENMKNKQRGTWIEIPAGEFTTLRDNTGGMDISLNEYNDYYWKSGLVIKGIIIRARN